MKVSNRTIGIALGLLAVLLVAQTWRGESYRRQCLQMRGQAAAFAASRQELQRLARDLADLRKQLAAAVDEVEQWRQRCRERERVNSRLKEDLARSATEIREIGAALELERQKSKPP